MKNYLFILLTACAYIFAGCSHSEHNHEAEVAHHDHAGHDHSEHNHAHHDHTGHDHAHEGHDHHNHDHHGHAHEAVATEEHAHEGGISLKPGEAEEIGLATEEVKLGAFESVIRCTGTIIGAAGDVVTVVAPQSGVVHYTRQWADGAAVTAGTALFTISSRHVGDGDAAERARVAYETAKAEYDRAAALVDEKIVSQRDYEQARERYETARLAYEAMGGGTAAGAQAKATKGGFVSQLLVREGDYVEAGTPLATVAQNKRLQLRAEVPQRYYKELPMVRTAHFKTPYDETVYELPSMNGRLLSYGRNTGEALYYMPVTFDFDNRGTVVPGTSVEVYLMGATRNNVITLPAEAITEEQGLFFVYRRLCENSFEKVEVKIGATNGSRVEILSGVNQGDNIVTNGVRRVKLAANSGVIPEGHSHNH